MKEIIISIMFILSWPAISQITPVIYTQVSTISLQYSRQEVQEWERYLKILRDSTENEDIKLSANDKKFKDMFEAKHNTHEDEYYEVGMPPWEIEGPGCSWYCGANYETKVSSFLPSRGTNVYSEKNLHDDDTRSAWVEGVPGYGIGEFIEFSFPYYSARATTAFIANGYNKDATTWRNNSRVKTFTIYEEDRLIGIVHLKDIRNLQIFKLPYPFPNRKDNTDFSENIYDEKTPNSVTLKFVITDVYKGDKYDDTAISEFIFSGLDVHCLAEGSLVKTADKSEKKIENIIPGDLILTYNYKKNILEPKPVTKTYSVIHQNLIKITLKHLTENIEIITTEDHPFYTDKGWMSYNPQKTKLYQRYTNSEVLKYKQEDLFYFYDSDNILSIPIEKIELVNTHTKTYTLEIEGENAFIVNNVMAGQE